MDNLGAHESVSAPEEGAETLAARESDAHPWPSAFYSWGAVSILTFAFMLAYVDRIIISMIVDPLKADLGISDFQVSLLQGVSFTLFYSTMGVPIAYIVDRHSRTRIIALGVAVWSIATAACGFVQHFWQLFLMRIGVGVGEGTLQPSAFSMISDLFPPHRLGIAMSVYSLGAFMGAAFAFLLAGALIDLAEFLAAINFPVFSALRPWQAVFVTVGAPGVLVAVMVLLLREPRRRHQTQSIVSEAPFMAQLKKNWRAYSAHGIGFGLITLANQSIYAWTPSLLQRVHGLSPAESGTRLGLVFLISGPIGILVGGTLCDYLIKRGRSDASLWVGVMAAVGVFPFILLGPMAGSANMLLALYVPLGFFLSFSFGAAAAGIQVITPSNCRARASAFYVLVINLLGLGIGPTATAYFTVHVFKNDLAVGQSLAVVGSLACVLAVIVFVLGSRPFRKAARDAME